MINDLCKKTLEKKGYKVLNPDMVDVYIQTMEARMSTEELLMEIISDYNSLVQSYAELMTGSAKPSTKPLLADLKEAEVKTRGIKGEDLAKLYFETFSIELEDEEEETDEESGSEDADIEG